jgi:hypothetical protein
MSDQIIQVTTWRAGGSAFPERAHPVLGPYLSARDDFGIALAGGGARGAAVALGATRALRAAGLLDRARYLCIKRKIVSTTFSGDPSGLRNALSII